MKLHNKEHLVAAGVAGIAFIVLFGHGSSPTIGHHTAGRVEYSHYSDGTYLACRTMQNGYEHCSESRSLADLMQAANTQASQSDTSVSIPMQPDGGTYVVPTRINNAITLNFTVDSGAADVVIPADVVSTLIRAGALDSSDFIGSADYVLADGSIMPSTKFRIRSLKVGNLTVENVSGSIAPIRASLLLGQSFLGRFQSWSIDNARRALVLVEK